MEGITEPGLLPFFGSQCFDWLEIEIEVQMEVVQIFTVDQQVQHIVALSADLETSLNPVQLCQLEELCLLKSFEKVALGCRLWASMVQGILYPTFQKFLVRNAHFYRVALGTVFFKPVAH